MSLILVLSVTGVFCLLLLSYILGFQLRKIVDVRKMGKWAVVTGATDGLGKCFTHELAKMGLDIVLLSRNIDKLESCAKEIKKMFHVSTKVIQADFTSLDEEMYDRIRRELADMDIGVLVNNVGIIHDHPEYFHLLDAHHGSDFQNIINCNITSAVNMTRFVLSGMVARKRGLIINISSLTSEMPSPLVTMYAATKSFLAKMSTDLNLEYRKKGVHVHVLRAGFVATKLSDVKKIFGFVPSPEVYVRGALQKTLRSSDCDGYFGHWLWRVGANLGGLLIPCIVHPFIMRLFVRRRKAKVHECRNCSPQREEAPTMVISSKVPVD